MSTTTEPVSFSSASKGYVNPDVLVTTDWVAQHLNDPKVRILESDEDVLLYDLGHIPGAQKIDWHTDLNDSLVRDYVSKEQFQTLLRRLGIDESTTVVFYGDKSNWWATYAFWVFQLFGFTNTKVVDGGRAKWEAEGRPFSTEVPKYPATQYVAKERDDSKIRAFKEDTLKHSQAKKPLIDVRSPGST
jgi:thiosulfate/3-mercaptopyruvate sulfurtransferase